MDFQFDARTTRVRDKLLPIMDSDVYPAEPAFP
jgi:hypothetical protein